MVFRTDVHVPQRHVLADVPSGWNSFWPSMGSLGPASVLLRDTMVLIVGAEYVAGSGCFSADLLFSLSFTAMWHVYVLT